MKKRVFPNALAIVVAFILAAGILTYVIPKGQYQRIIDPETKREIVLPGSYAHVDAKNLSPFEILVCIPRGIVNGGEVMVLIFLVGGCLYIVDKTGALKEGVAHLTSKLKGKEETALIVVAMLFGIGGVSEGLEEEIIPLIPVLLVFTRNLGYPPITAVGISYGAATIGAAFSPINPFGVVIAQKIADVPFLSGSLIRLIVLALAFSLWMFMIIRFSNKHRITKPTEEVSNNTQLNKIHVVILFLVLAAFSLLIYGMLFLGWGFNQLSAEFFVFGIVIGLVGGLGIDGTFKAYAEGLKEMTFACMIIGFAYGISLVLKEGLILDTIIYGLFTPLQSVPPALSALGMMGSQALLHIAMPSYSGQAVLTMPILAPLSALIGISRDICVLAFQFGAILMNLIIPTNGALMAIIAIAGISYDEWFLFALKRMLIIFALCAATLLVATLFGV